MRTTSSINRPSPASELVIWDSLRSVPSNQPLWLAFELKPRSNNPVRFNRFISTVFRTTRTDPVQTDRCAVFFLPSPAQPRLRRPTMSPTHSDADSLSPLAAFPLDPTLTLTPRVKLNLSIYPAVGAGAKPVDHWQIKRALLDYLKTASRSLGAASLQISGAGDPKKRRRGDAVAHGVLIVRDLGSVKEEDYGEWKENELRGRLDGIELVLEGARFRVSAEVLAGDSFEGLRKEWQEYYAFKNKGQGRGAREEPDTIVVRGLPSRWFAETRVSSKPSMLVTHTIFSTLGSIRRVYSSVGLLLWEDRIYCISTNKIIVTVNTF